MPETQPQKILISAKLLLEYIQHGEAADDIVLRNDAASLKSWLVWRLQYRTITVPAELRARYYRLLAYYSLKEK